jgi:hypothetical protein
MLLTRPGLYLAEHFHRGIAVASNASYDTGIQQEDDTLVQRYSFIDLDPLGDGSFAIKTTGHNRVNLRINQEPTADAIRVLPVELVKVGQAA